MDLQFTSEYNAAHRVLRGHIGGRLDRLAIQQVMVDVLSGVRSNSARGAILDLTNATVVLGEDDYPKLQDFFLELRIEVPVPIGLVSRERFSQAIKYARHAQEDGRAVQACLTYGEGLAWIDYNTVGYVPTRRQLTLRRIHDEISLLSDPEAEALLEAIEAREVPRPRSQ